MTDQDYTDNVEVNEILLKACRCSMLVTGDSPSQFISRLHKEDTEMSKLINRTLKKRLREIENGDKSFWQRLGLVS